MGRDVSAAYLEDRKCRLERLKNEKGRLCRLLGEARGSGGDADQWITEVQAVSREIKKLQKLIKKPVNGSKVDNKWVPQTLLPPVSISDKPVDKPITVQPCVGVMREAAEDYVWQHPGSSVWLRPLISYFIERTYGHKTLYLCATTASGELAGILPLVQLKTLLFGNYIVSMPFFNYGGLLADNSQVAHELIKAADEWREQEGARHVEMRFLQDNKLGLPQRTDKVSFWLPLPEQIDMLWDSFKPKLRSQIRRGDRELSELVIGGCELLEEFYQVFSINMRDLGTPVYSRTFFRNLLEDLEGGAWLVVARVDGRAVGCAFLTGYRDRMEIPWASTLRKYSQTSVNMIMYWKILEFAVSQKFKVFDFGRCTKNAGTYKFKKQWGAQCIPLYWDYSLSAGEEIEDLSPKNPKFQLFIAIWKCLPVSFTKIIGPPLIKYLP